MPPGRPRKFSDRTQDHNEVCRNSYALKEFGIVLLPGETLKAGKKRTGVFKSIKQEREEELAREKAAAKAASSKKKWSSSSSSPKLNPNYVFTRESHGGSAPKKAKKSGMFLLFIYLDQDTIGINLTILIYLYINI